MSDALVIGSIALDSVRTPHGEVKDALGGSASYGSVAISHFAPVSLVGVVGRDFSEEHIALFRSRGIGTDGLQIVDGQTFRWAGYYERNMARAHTISTHLNVFEHFVPKLSPAQAKARFVFLANIHPALQLSVLEQLKSPELVALDTMNLWIGHEKAALTKVIERVHLMLMNEDEARQYTGHDNLIEAGKALLGMGPRIVVIKKGEHGALLFQNSGLLAVPAIPLQSVKDPTGAGDSFAGGLVGYLAKLGEVTDDNVRRAVAIGTCVASFTVEDFSLNRLTRLTGAELRERVATLNKLMTPPAIDPKTLEARQG